MIEVAAILSRVQTALILLPARLEEFSIAIKIFPELRKGFNDTKLDCVIDSQYTSLLPENTFNRVIQFDQNSLSAFGTPSKALLSQISRVPYELLIDLSGEFNLASTFICSKSTAKLRVCLAHPHREAFYNLQIRTKAGDPLQNKYLTLIHYLSALIPSSKTPQDLLPA